MDKASVPMNTSVKTISENYDSMVYLVGLNLLSNERYMSNSRVLKTDDDSVTINLNNTRVYDSRCGDFHIKRKNRNTLQRPL